jgi:hypothetical protein
MVSYQMRKFLDSCKFIESFSKGQKMSSTQIHWKGQYSPQPLTFGDLSANDAFKIRGHNAVYLKVVSGRNSGLANTGGMLEIATGKIFGPTSSEVERVNVEIHVGTTRPSIY